MFDTSTPPATTTTGTLATIPTSRPTHHNSGIGYIAWEQTRRFFRSHTNHRPSERTYAALRDIADTLEAMATGKAAPRLFLSSLDPGQGKSTVLSYFIKTLLQHQMFDHVGVLVCVGRLDEITKLVNAGGEMVGEITDAEELTEDEKGTSGRHGGLDPSTFACLTTDDGINRLGLGSERAGEARVMFTTQQMVASRTARMDFSACRDFFFNGKPRQVRAWDEAWLPGEPLTLGAGAISSVLKGVERHRRLYSAILRLLVALDGAEDGDTLDIPDFAEDFGVSSNDVAAMLEGENEKTQAAGQGLWHLGGKAVVIRRDGGKDESGNTAVTYRDVYPRDLAPMIILDASGRVRGTYPLLIEERGLITPLITSAKNYANLDCKVWTTAGSKSGWRANTEKLIDGIVRTVREEPDRDWLVVHHKKGGEYKIADIEALIRQDLGPDARNLSCITWGKHIATNDYRDCDRIILAGTIFLRLSTYEAFTHMAAGHKAEDGKAPKNWLDQITIGESRDKILQAGCRGAIRKSDGDGCAPGRLFIIASAHSGIRDALPDIFPGCKIDDWKQPVEMIVENLKGYDRAAHGELSRWSTEDGKGVYTFARLKKAIGLRDPSNFRRLRRNPDFQEALSTLGLVEHKPKKNSTGWKLPPNVQE